MAPDLRAILTAALSKETGPSSDFDLNREIARPAGRAMRDAGVLVGIFGDGRVLLTKRASHLSQHPGQIAFPGGKMEPGDADVTAAALREAWEETALPPEAVTILGPLPGHETVTNYRMTPVLGLIDGAPRLRPEIGEVAEIFTVPLAFLTDPANYTVQSREWRGTARHYYAAPYGPYYIWGATARVLRGLAERLA